MNNKKEKELLRKFEVMKRWMIDDVKRAMFFGKANFLAAQGLVIYTEFIGSLITGKGEGSGAENFDTFFRRLGIEYKKLLRKHNNKRKKRKHVVYDDIRCGLIHEYAVKRKGFVIYNSDKELSDEDITNITHVELDKKQVKVKSGVMLAKDDSNKDYWLFLDPIYWLDFKSALEDYSKEIGDVHNTKLRENFFKRIKDINIKNFNV